MSDNHSPNTPGNRRVTIPVPPHLYADPEADGVLMHDDLEILLEDAQAVCLTLGSMVELLRGAGSVNGSGVAELLEGVRMRAELVFEAVQGVHHTVLSWGSAPG